MSMIRLINSEGQAMCDLQRLRDTHHGNNLHETSAMKLQVTRRAARNEIKVEGNMPEAERDVRRENGGNDHVNERKTEIKKFRTNEITK